MASEDFSERYTLKVTAGPTYDPKTHQTVPVNADETLTIESEHTTVKLCVRIRDYNGLPPNTPRTSRYFTHPDRQHDQYSIAVGLVPKRPIRGSELVFGNDFDRPIRDRLPPGTNYALKIVKWMIDPGLEGDAYADQPYLYGAALSSWNYFRICERVGRRELVSKSGVSISMNRSEGEGDGEGGNNGSITMVQLHEEVIEEGGEGTGMEIRESLEIPNDAALRKKHFLDESNRHMFEFEAGRLYKADFGNPYLGFNDFSLRLPGFNLNIAKFIDQKNHELRYVLKNKNTGDVYFVVVFTLLLNGTPENSEDEGQKEGEQQQPIEESEVD